MEIERKFLIQKMPSDLENYKSRLIEQAYLNVKPVVRVRREDETYYMTYKGGGMMAREEYNLPLDADSYAHLLQKADGNIITKRRYLIPLAPYTIELDVFSGIFEGVIVAEVEFPSIEEAESFSAPDWFGEDVTYDGRYHNSVMSRLKVEEIVEIQSLSDQKENDQAKIVRQGKY